MLIVSGCQGLRSRQGIVDGCYVLTGPLVCRPYKVHTFVYRVNTLISALIPHISEL